jgi:membrane carboxypeptidase/penicillin-binding protein
MASAALIAGSVVTTGGITALAAKIVGRKTGKTGTSNNSKNKEQ